MNIVVTGASNGIGYHACLALARSGNHRIFALARDEERLARLKAEAEQQPYQGQVIPLSMDLSDPASIGSAAKELTRQAGSLEIVVNNAGKLIHKPFSELSLQEWKDIYNVNVFGVAELTRQLMPLLRAATVPAHVVNISSMGGVQGSGKFSGLSAYSSSKAAVIVLTECLAEEFKEYRVSVNCLALGSVATEMFSAAFPGHQAALTPGEMADFVADFALSGHKYFNGKTLPVSLSTP